MQISNESLFEVVANSLNVPVDSLSLESGRDSLKDWDSMGHIMLMLAVERRFGRKLPFEAIERIRTIADIQAALLKG